MASAKGCAGYKMGICRMCSEEDRYIPNGGVCGPCRVKLGEGFCLNLRKCEAEAFFANFLL